MGEGYLKPSCGPIEGIVKGMGQIMISFHDVHCKPGTEVSAHYEFSDCKERRDFFGDTKFVQKVCNGTTIMRNL